ncbi:MAG: hypothetical protein Kow0069_11690 [Promethearchaeota archaeon]
MTQVSVHKEDVEVLAYKLYRENRPYDEMVRRLAELCETIKKTVAEARAFDASCLEDPLQSTKLDASVRLELKRPSDEEVERTATKIKAKRPAKAELHWFIAEKMLLLRELLDAYGENA